MMHKARTATALPCQPHWPSRLVATGIGKNYQASRVMDLLRLGTLEEVRLTPCSFDGVDRKYSRKRHIRE